MENPVQLTLRFTQATDYARQVHVSLRKGTQVPYMAHLLGVASLVLGETGHVGLDGIRERLREVDEVDGKLDLPSTANGTILRVSLPVTDTREPYRASGA